jgi:hypothetical protein
LAIQRASHKARLDGARRLLWSAYDRPLSRASSESWWRSGIRRWRVLQFRPSVRVFAVGEVLAFIELTVGRASRRAGQFAPAVEAVLIGNDLSVVRELLDEIAGFSVFSFRFSVNRKNSSLNTDD